MTLFWTVCYVVAVILFIAWLLVGGRRGKGEDPAPGDEAGGRGADRAPD